MKEKFGMPQWLADRRKQRVDDGAVDEQQMLGSLDGTYFLSRHWDDNTEHGLTRDVAFNRHSMNDGHHVSPFDNSRLQVGTDGIEVKLVQKIDEEAFKRTLSAATRATIGIDIDQPAALDPDKDWEEMLRGGLQTALETQTIVFAVKGASRTATHQLVRSRRAAFHQQSQRASYMGDFPECRIPESVWRNDVARNAFLESVLTAHRAYRTICDEDISYQDARFVLPEGTCNFILLEYPVREFLAVYAYRACSMFQWEIVDIVRKCREVLVAEHPWLAPHIKISCQSQVCLSCAGTGKLRSDDDQPQVVSCSSCSGTGMVGNRCTFQGWETVEGQCDFPWAKEDLRTFQPVHHKIARGKS